MLKVFPRASLKPFNTFGVAASAARRIDLHSLDDLDALRSLLAGERPALLLGGGSNLLLTRDLDATVLRIATRGIQLAADDGAQVLVRAAAGERWHDFVEWTLANGCFGLENLSLIPGSVGASPIQNIGAYGVELREHFDHLSAFNLATGERRDFDGPACAFAYRHSLFKLPAFADWLITDVWFRLSRTPAPNLGYADLREELCRRGLAEPTPQQVADAVCDIRRRKLPDPAQLGNAGSFFKNPLVEATRVAGLQAQFPKLPIYPAGAPGTMVKLSAGWLIDHCGWKGYRDGDAGVHSQHALVLVNHGGASGAQLLALARAIQQSVLQRTGVMLEPEPVIL